MARIDFVLSAAQRADAREGLRTLEGSGISLAEAARRAVAGKKALKRATVAECVDWFVRAKLLEGLRQQSVDWYENKLSGFVHEFGGLEMDGVSRAELRRWLGDLKHTANTTAAKARAVRAFWRWAMAQEPPYAGTDITSGLRTSSSRTEESGDIEFLTVGECATIMRGAGDYQAAMALMLFAGVRPGEVAGQHKEKLLWKHVRRQEKLIRIPASIAKSGRNGRSRQIEGLPPALWKWLPPGDDSDPVCSSQALQAVRLAQRLAGYDTSRPWPHDALRHTFATYHCAAFEDPGKLALLLGHEGSVSLLYRHYRGLATKAQAKEFWTLRPIVA